MPYVTLQYSFRGTFAKVTCGAQYTCNNIVLLGFRLDVIFDGLKYLSEAHMHLLEAHTDFTRTITQYKHKELVLKILCMAIFSYANNSNNTVSSAL